MNIWINEATIHSVNITLTDKDNNITKTFPVGKTHKTEHPTTPEDAIQSNDPESYKSSLHPKTEDVNFSDPKNIRSHLDIPIVVTDDLEYVEPPIEDLIPKIKDSDDIIEPDNLEIPEPPAPPVPPTPPIPEIPEVILHSQETPEKPIIDEIPQVETVPIIQEPMDEFKPSEVEAKPEVLEEKEETVIEPEPVIILDDEKISEEPSEDILENVKFKNPLTNMYITWDKSAEMVIMDRHREMDMCQCWSLITVKDGAEPHIPKFRIKNSFTGEYLVFKDFHDIDAKERKTLKERDIITAPLGDGSEFLWLLVPVPPNTSTDNLLIINSRSKLVCDIYMHAVVPGTKIIQYNFRGGNNQLFTLEKV